MAIAKQYSERAQSALSAQVEPPNKLRRILGMWDLVLMTIGTVIASGIFLESGVILRAVNNSVPSALGVWLAGGALSLPGALTFGELSAIKSRAGRLYVYLRDCFSTFPAFLFGWNMFFVPRRSGLFFLATKITFHSPGTYCTCLKAANL